MEDDLKLMINQLTAGCEFILSAPNAYSDFLIEDLRKLSLIIRIKVGLSMDINEALKTFKEWEDLKTLGNAVMQSIIKD